MITDIEQFMYFIAYISIWMHEEFNSEINILKVELQITSSAVPNSREKKRIKLPEILNYPTRASNNKYGEKMGLVLLLQIRPLQT